MYINADILRYRLIEQALIHPQINPETILFHLRLTESHGNQTCFEGFGRHTLDRCFYLRKDLRPNGWAMKTGAVKLMLKGLNKQPDLQERHQEAIKEMEDFLDESKKGSRSIIGSA